LKPTTVNHAAIIVLKKDLTILSVRIIQFWGKNEASINQHAHHPPSNEIEVLVKILFKRAQLALKLLHARERVFILQTAPKIKVLH
jgi:hypothetical protein